MGITGKIIGEWLANKALDVLSPHNRFTPTEVKRLMRQNEANAALKDWRCTRYNDVQQLMCGMWGCYMKPDDRRWVKDLAIATIRSQTYY